jgi:hypothetical protein
MRASPLPQPESAAFQPDRHPAPELVGQLGSVATAAAIEGSAPWEQRKSARRLDPVDWQVDCAGIRAAVLRWPSRVSTATTLALLYELLSAHRAGNGASPAWR